MRIVGWVLAASLPALAAEAQTTLGQGSPVTLSGRIVVDASRAPLSAVANNTLVDLDLTLAPGAGPLPEGMGLELGLYHHDSAIPFFGGTAGFAALTFDLAGGRLALGAPRSAADGLPHAPLPAGLTAGLHGIQALLGGMPMSVTLQALLGEPFWGLRYDSRFGALDWSVSATRSGGFLPTTDLAVGVSGDFAFLHLYGAGEAYSDGASWVTTVRIGGQLPLAPSDVLHSAVLGVEYSHSALGGTADYSLNGYATLGLNESTSVTLSALTFNSSVGGGSRMFGLSLDHEVWNGVQLSVGALTTAGFPGTTYTAALTRRF